jgi:hypothetical protein
MSTTEAEYMAVAEAAQEALWLTGLVKELGVEQDGVQLHCDSQSAIYLENNQVYHDITKHIDVRFHKIRELLASGQILLEKIHTLEKQLICWPCQSPVTGSIIAWTYCMFLSVKKESTP